MSLPRKPSTAHCAPTKSLSLSSSSLCAFLFVLLASCSSSSAFPMTASTQAANTTQIPITNYRDQVYLVPIKVGPQTLQAVLDTGSSDTWFASSAFECSNPAGCKFGKGYAQTSSPSFKAVTGQKFSITYSGEYLSGTMGTESVGLGDLAVEGQPIGVVSSGLWKGDGLSSGLLGMGFASGSAVYDSFRGAGGAKYSPPFTAMHKKGLTAPVFSIALNRLDEGPGVLTLGGLPTPSQSLKFDSSNFTTAKMQYLTFSSSANPNVPGLGETDPRNYRMTVDSIAINGRDAPGASKIQLTLDTGTGYHILPREAARAFNEAFVPKARFDRAQGWQVECTAQAPRFAVKIAGVTFEMEPRDLIIPPEVVTDAKAGAGGGGGGGQLCGSAVQDGSFPGGYLLGANFLKSVVAVCDVGKMEMRFARRIR